MTALTGSALRTSTGGSVNAALSAQLGAYQADYWPPHQAASPRVGAAAAVTAFPVSTSPRVLTGAALRYYADDYYDRVHLRPDAIALGNLSTAQTRSAEVWNAWRSRTLTLDAVQASNADGMTVTAPAALPMDFAPLQLRTWQVGIGLDGPASIDATLQWLFADPTQDVAIKITGQRVIAWTLVPDWDQGITETLEWLTDVEEAVGGAQDRTPSRDAPRRTWEFPVIAYSQDRQVMEALLFAASARVFALPVWPDISLLAADLAAGADSIPLDTANLDFAIGDQAMLWQSPTDYELVEVSDIASNALMLARATVNAWPIGARIYPCRLALLTDTAQLTRHSDRLASVTLRFRANEPCDWPALAPAAVYLGFPVLEQRSNEAQDLAAGFGRKVAVIDNDVGLPVVDDISGLAWPTQQHYWLLNGRAERGAHRSLLYWLQGRANALWLPSWQDDLTLTAPLGVLDTAFTIEWTGATRLLAQQSGARHLRIELYDGSVFYRRVTTSTDNGATEQLAIDSALNREVQPSDVRQINWLRLATLAGDSVQIAHLADSLGVATSAATFAGVPAEEP